MQRLSDLMHQAQTHQDHKNQLNHQDHEVLQAQQYLLHFRLRLNKSIDHRLPLFNHSFALSFEVDCLPRKYYFSKLLFQNGLLQNLHLP